MIVACTFSGFAGVYFEKVLKGSTASVWLRNIQLGIFGTIMAFIGAYMKEGSAITEKGFLFGYNNLVWVVVANQVICSFRKSSNVIRRDTRLLNFRFGAQSFFCEAASTRALS